MIGSKVEIIKNQSQKYSMLLKVISVKKWFCPDFYFADVGRFLIFHFKGLYFEFKNIYSLSLIYLSINEWLTHSRVFSK